MIQDTNTSGGVLSEGKLLEITPIIELNNRPFMLPPVVWRVTNWMLAFHDFHTLGYPQILISSETLMIPGSYSANYATLRLMIRVLEDSPDIVPETVSTMEADCIKELIIKKLTPNKCEGCGVDSTHTLCGKCQTEFDRWKEDKANGI